MGSTIAEPPLPPQNNPDSQGPQSPGQAPAPEVQTRISLAVTPVPAVSSSATINLEHDDRFPSQATAQHPHLQLQLDSEHHHQLQHHVDGSTSASAPAGPGPTQSQSQSQNELEAANIAHFDALGHDFDKQNPFSAEFADRLSRALRRLSHSGSAGSHSDSDNDVGSLVLDEDTTSVLDYACGSGTCHTPIFRVGMVF
jgi:hypothetical protein